MGTAVFKAFGYPDIKPKLVRVTESGGAELAHGNLKLLIDKHGTPWTFKIKEVRFESSQADKTLPKIKDLLRKFPLALPKGRWVTERSLGPHPYGNAKSSMRYFFVPTLHGYPFLRSSQMTVQFSHDSKRVLEWMVHRWTVPESPLPKRVISMQEAKRRFQEIGDQSAQRYKSAHAQIGNPELGWRGIAKPVLTYTCPVTVSVRLPGRVRGSGTWVDINAETGELTSGITR